MLLQLNVLAQKDSLKQTVSDDNLSSMSLTDLVNADVLSPSLTEIKNELTPLPVIVISQTDIELSGARSLDELLKYMFQALTLCSRGGLRMPLE